MLPSLPRVQNCQKPSVQGAASRGEERDEWCVWEWSWVGRRLVGARGVASVGCSLYASGGVPSKTCRGRGSTDDPHSTGCTAAAVQKGEVTQQTLPQCEKTIQYIWANSAVLACHTSHLTPYHTTVHLITCPLETSHLLYSTPLAQLSASIQTTSPQYPNTTHSTTLHHTIPHYTTLHYTTLHHTLPHYTILYHTTPQHTYHTTPHCTTPQHTTPHYLHSTSHNTMLAPHHTTVVSGFLVPMNNVHSEVDHSISVLERRILRWFPTVYTWCVQIHHSNTVITWMTAVCIVPSGQNPETTEAPHLTSPHTSMCRCIATEWSTVLIHYLNCQLLVLCLMEYTKQTQVTPVTYTWHGTLACYMHYALYQCCISQYCSQFYIKFPCDFYMLCVAVYI